MIKGVKYISTAEISGYGLAGFAYTCALIEAGIPVTWHPVARDADRYRSITEFSLVADLMRGVEHGMDVARDAFRADVPYDAVIVHLFPEAWPAFFEPDKRMIGYTVWETDRIPKHWPDLLNAYDAVLTPSRFSRDVFARGGVVRPVEVIPHLPRSRWPAAAPDALHRFRRRFGIERDDVVFYTINDWILRKAMWLTLHGYLMAFDSKDKVVLFAKSSPYGERDRTMQWISTREMVHDIICNYPDPPRVVFVTEQLSENEIGLLHLSSDVYVSLPFCEGWGMGAFDAAGAGKPVIMTGWGGQMDFLPPEHACLVDYQLKPVKEHFAHHEYQEQHWAHADVDCAMSWMERLYASGEERMSRGQCLRRHIESDFSPDLIVGRLIEVLGSEAPGGGMSEFNPDIRLAQTHRGAFYVLGNDFLGRMLVGGYHFEDHILSAILPLLEEMKDRAVVDVGANLGCHAVPYALCVRKTVHAFEPQGMLYDLLLRNIDRNKCRNIAPYRVALGHEDNLVTTLSDEYELHDGIQSLDEPHAVHNYGGIGLGKGSREVLMKTLDSYRLTDVGLIKIDVEGAERLVLYGAEETIRSQRPYILFEQHPVHQGSIFEIRWRELCDMYSIPSSIRNTDIFDVLEDYGYGEIQRLDDVNYLAIP